MIALAITALILAALLLALRWTLAHLALYGRLHELLARLTTTEGVLRNHAEVLAKHDQDVLELKRRLTSKAFG